MVVHGYGKSLLGFVLPNHVLAEKIVNLVRLAQRELSVHLAGSLDAALGVEELLGFGECHFGTI